MRVAVATVSLHIIKTLTKTGAVHLSLKTKESSPWSKVDQVG